MNTGVPDKGVGYDALLAEIGRAIIHAFESGYIHGHNDTVDGNYNLDTHAVAEDRSREITKAVSDFLTANNRSSATPEKMP